MATLILANFFTNQSLVLTNYNFEGTIAKAEIFFVFAYIPGCQICDLALAFIDSLDKKLGDYFQKNIFGTLNLNKFEGNAKDLGFRALPTFRAYASNLNHYADFRGFIDENDLFAWMKSVAENKKTPQRILSSDDLEAFKKSYLAIFYRHPRSDKEAALLFRILQKLMPSADFFANTNYPENKFELELENSKESYCLSVQRNFDDGPKTLCSESPLDFEMLRQFIFTFSWPSAERINQTLAVKILQAKVPSFFLFAKSISAPEISDFIEFAIQNQSEIKFIYSDLTETNASGIAYLFDISKEKTPAFAILDYSNGRFTKYKSSDVSKSGLETFFKKFKGKSLQPFAKSETVKQQTGPLLTLTFSNFDKLVFETNRHVLVAFVNESCQYCKEAVQAFKKAAENKLKNKEIDFGIYNVDLNDPPNSPISLRKLPAIYFYRTLKKSNPYLFEGMREWEVMVNFIEKTTDEILFDKPIPEGIKSFNGKNTKKEPEYETNEEF